MALDPRLASEAVLRLAAYRLLNGPPPLPDWAQGEGLCALLETAKRLPRKSREEIEASVDERSAGIGKMLYEAIQWSQAHQQQEPQP